MAATFLKIRCKRETIAEETWIEPIRDIFSRYGTSLALLLLCLVGFYRISDIVLGVTSNLFYQDIGFTKVQIAGAVKTYGVIITIIGSFIGGFRRHKNRGNENAFVGSHLISRHKSSLHSFVKNWSRTNDALFCC